MLNFTVQAPINTECLQPLKKDRHRKGYFASYYQNNQQSLLDYSNDYHQVKKLLTPYSKENKKNTDRHRVNYYQEYEKNNPQRKAYKRAWIANKRTQLKDKSCVKSVVDNFLSHTSIKEHSQREKELFFVDNTIKKKQELVRRLDQKYLRLPTLNKIPQKKGWNMPWFEEWLDKSGLLKKYQEWSIRGGKQIGNKYLSFLDLDINKDDLEPWRIKQLEKNAVAFLDYLGCFYVKTKKGYHVYMLTDELLSNEMIYHVDSWLKKEKIVGSIQSKGKYVVGFDSKDKQLVERGQWFWHVKDLAQIKSTLEKFFLKVGRTEQETIKKTDDCLLKLQQAIALKRENVDNTFNTKKILSQVKILSKHKTCLEDIWKVFYCDWKTQTTGYFLVNDYQRAREFSGLELGGVRNISVVQGYKHQFLSRVG